MTALVYYFLAFNLSQAAPSCPAEDLKGCQQYLKSLSRKTGDSAAFAAAYNEVCSTNPKFSCVKITVRADVAVEMKEQAKIRGPKAALYDLILDGENFIFVLTSK